jgi:hypothetical protein
MEKKRSLLERRLRNKMRSKRGFEMAFSTLVAIVLALILLALLIVFLTGSFGKFKDKISNFFSSSNVDSVVDNCNRLVISESFYEYCCVNKTLKMSGKEKYEQSCFNIFSGNYSWAKNLEKLNCEGVC